MRRTKIVCTLGPATNDRDAINRLIAAGMDCARLNFSHGSHKDHATTYKHVREAALAAGRPIAILVDLCGPKMRVGRFRDGPVDLRNGERFTLTTDAIEGDATRVSVSYDRLAADLIPGDQVLLDDGLLRLSVEEIRGNDVRCKVEEGGRLSDRKGLNLPGARLSAPALTEKDRADLNFATRVLGTDLVALSFVRNAEDVREAKELAGNTPVIAKIEKPEALEQLGAIIRVADGCMVARGDLGVEMGAEKVPLIQKRIIREANKAGKLVITATHMLDSMTNHPRPTRAEANDVANAVLDGSDALMLSAETAVGRYPSLTIETMSKIICEVESACQDGESGYQRELSLTEPGEWSFLNAAAKAATLLSAVLPLRAIVCFTRNGRAPRLISEYRPRAPIVAITSDAALANRLAVEWGVLPRVAAEPDGPLEALRIATDLIRLSGLCKEGDAFALVTRFPAGERTNSVQLHRL